MGGDPGAFSQSRARAGGGCKEARLDDAAIRQRHIAAIGPRIERRHRGGPEIDTLGLGALDQRIDQMPVFDHMRERFAGLDIARESQEHRTGGVLQSGIGDDHVEDRLRLGGDVVPHPDGIEQPAAGRDDRGRARIAARAACQRRIGDDDRNIGAKALPQGQSQRQPGECAATDDNATLCRHAVPYSLTSSDYNLRANYSWAKQVPQTRGIHCHSGARIFARTRNDRETGSTTMSKGLIDLISILDLEPIEVNLFRGSSPKTSWQRVFGGQVIGQAMVAACRTVEGRLPHSLHCYFILPGDPQIPIIYEVERLRDGKSYSTRPVTPIHHGNAIFSIMVSFHIDEQGSFDHQDKMPNVPPPEKLTAEEVAKQPMFLEMPDFIRRYYESDRPIELRPVELGRYFGQKIEDGRIHVWIRTASKLPDDPALHMCALAYASDFSLLDAVMARYGRTLFAKRMIPASLDHAMWFHRPCRADEWLLYPPDSPSARGGRGR